MFIWSILKIKCIILIKYNWRRNKYYLKWINWNNFSYLFGYSRSYYIYICFSFKFHVRIKITYRSMVLLTFIMVHFFLSCCSMSFFYINILEWAINLKSCFLLYYYYIHESAWNYSFLDFYLKIVELEIRIV